MLGEAKSGVDRMLGEARPNAERTLGGARPGTDGDAGQEFGGARSHGEGDVEAQNAGCQNAVFRSTVVESINALREDVVNLRSELGEIKRSGASVSSHRAPGKLCTLYVRVPEGGSEVSHIGKARLESLLDCEVPQYVCIKQLPSSFKVKILESCLQSAVDSGRRHGCFVDCWCAQTSVRRFEGSDFTTLDRKRSQSGIQLS